MAELMEKLLTAAQCAPAAAVAPRVPIVGAHHAPVADTWQAEFAAMAQAIKARHARPAGPSVVTAPENTLRSLRLQLAGELADFDPAYDFSDDHGFWCQQSAKALRITHLRREIAKLEGQAC